MAKKREISLSYEILGELTVTVRFLGKVARLGESEIKANWAYEIKHSNSEKGHLFKGADLYTFADRTHSEAAAELLDLHMPVDGVVPSWFNADTLSLKQAQWFLGGYKRFESTAQYGNLAHAPSVLFIRGDNTGVPMDENGIPLDASVLGEESEGTAYLAEATN